MKTIQDPIELMRLNKPPVWPVVILAVVVWTTWLVWKFVYQDDYPHTVLWMGYIGGGAGVMMLAYMVYVDRWMRTEGEAYGRARIRARMAFLFLEIERPNDWIKTKAEAEEAIAEAMKWVPKDAL